MSLPPPNTRRAAACRRAFTLVEIMVSLAVLSIASMGGVAAFMTLNRYAANLRNLAVARALCQERIEQALTLTFRPTASLTPAAPSSDPSNTSALSILGVANSSATTNYNVSTGVYSGSNYQTSESIPVYTQPDGTSAKSSANVTFTRTSTVSPTAFNYTGSSPTTSLNLVLFTVNVSYVFHGQTYTTSMSTMRSPD